MPPYWICIELRYKDHSISLHFEKCVIVVYVGIFATGELLRCVTDYALLDL